MIPHYVDHSANERTFLTWVRTSIGVVGFGIAAGRIDGNPDVWSERILLGSGAGLILLAFVRMRLLRAKIIAEEVNSDDGLLYDILFLGVVTLLFVMLGAFAFHVRSVT